jgi:hypothetical protein
VSAWPPKTAQISPDLRAAGVIHQALLGEQNGGSARVLLELPDHSV